MLLVIVHSLDFTLVQAPINIPDRPTSEKVFDLVRFLANVVVKQSAVCPVVSLKRINNVISHSRNYYYVDPTVLS